MKARLPQSIVKMADRFEALSIRERILIMATIITLVFIAWDNALMLPLSTKQENLIIEMQSVNKQLDKITTQMTLIAKKKPQDNGPELQKRIDDIKQLLVNANKKQTEVTGEFVPPEQMSMVLRDMLEAENGLVLKQLKSLGTTTFKGNNRVVSAKTVDENDNPEKQKSTIYKHGLKIVFEGDFFTTLKYLKSLEAMPWHFYWDTVDYKVQEFPKARVSIIIHTLSLEAWWIGV